MEEKRQHERLSSNISIQYQAIDHVSKEGKVFLEGSPRQTGSSDLSVGGVKLHTREPIPTRTDLQLTIELPHFRDPLIVLGEVMRSAKTGDRNWEIGVRFEKITEQDQRRIRQFIELVHEDLITHTDDGSD